MLFAVYIAVLLAYEATAIVTGRRWPPTVTELVRALPGGWQPTTAVALVLIPLDHLVTEWLP